MEIDIFPVTTPDTPLTFALALMDSWNRSGVVVDSGQQRGFVRAGEVVVAMAEQSATTLKPLAERNPIDFIEPAILKQTRFDFRQGDPHVALEQYLGTVKRTYALIAMTSSRAVVASRHEDDMPTQAKPQDCYCRTDFKEVVPGKTGGNCPHDPRHKGTVRCR